ncbi:MAG TPA: hypothetical protein VK524_27135 [Polyangiaceae bacterium]|nr:hypothetical protein [Polyangiaceae bacterium]
MNEEAEFAAASKAFKPPSRAPVVSAALLGLVLGAVVGAGIMAATGGASSRRSKVVRAEKAAVASAPAASASHAPASAAPQPSLAERAASGDAVAVKAIEAKPLGTRTSAEVLALSNARAAVKRAEITELKRKITLVPKIVDEDKATRERIKELVADREVATDILAMLASLPDTVGTDLLYSLFRGMDANTENALLTEGLLYSSDVKAKVSPALGSILEVRKAETCEQAQAALKKVKDDGDKRAIPQLIRFHNKRGCGPKKLDDCWRCLRAPDVLKDVLTAIIARPTL